MLNSLYTPSFNYKHNIIPAPNPHYLLNKFYGNMTIKEYRELIKANKQHILLINKCQDNFSDIFATAQDAVSFFNFPDRKCRMYIGN